MKRIAKQKAFEREYSAVVLFIEDLKEIIEVLSEDGTRVTIVKGDYEYESVDDAKEHLGTKSQYELKLVRADNLFDNVVFSRSGARLYLPPREGAAQSFHELDAILTRCQRKPSFLYGSFSWVVIFAIGWAAGGITTNVEGHLKMVLLALQLFTFFLGAHAAYVTMRKHSIIRFERRAEKSSFFERHRDPIIMSVITGLIGGAIGFAFGQIKERASAPPAIPAAPSAPATPPAQP